MRRLVLASCLILVASGNVAAAPPGALYARAPTVTVTVPAGSAGLPARKAAGGGAAAAGGAAAPGVTVASVVGAGGGGQVRQEQIELLVGLIEATADTEVEEKGDLLFRLAQAHEQRFRALRVDAKTGKEAATALQAAVKVYQRLTSTAALAAFTRMDEALFGYAFMLQDGKYLKESRALFQRLIKDHPASAFVPDAYVVFGDYYFDSASLADARQFYEKALQFPKARIYGYALYKMAWVHLNLSEGQDALEKLFELVALPTGAQKSAPLHQAAVQDFVRAFAEVGKAQVAYKTFQRVDKAAAGEMLELLAGLYVDRGENEKAIYTYRELITLDASSARLCAWQGEIARATLVAGTDAQKVDEIGRLVKLYKHLGLRNALPAAEAQACAEDAALAGAMARAYHDQSIKTKGADAQGYAAVLYAAYLDAFPAAADRGETEYLYAELQWARADWKAAAEAFGRVVASNLVAPRLIRESAQAATLAWKNALAIAPAFKAPKALALTGKKLPQPRPIPDDEQHMLDAFAAYAPFLSDPKDEELIAMKWIASTIFRRYDHLDEARTLWRDLVSNHGHHKVAEYAAALVAELDSFVVQ